ncbi:hypothetical protein D3C71_2188590 [compost metagenome]
MRFEGKSNKYSTPQEHEASGPERILLAGAVIWKISSVGTKRRKLANANITRH